VSSRFVKPSGSMAGVLGSPEVVVADVSILRPFVINLISNIFLSLVLRVFQPIRSEDPAAVGAITAKAAYFFLRKGEPPFVIDSVLNAGCTDLGKDGPTEIVVAPICPINSFPVIHGVIKEQSIACVFGLVDCVGLVEGDEVGKVVLRWINSSNSQNQDAPDSDSCDLDHFINLNRFLLMASYDPYNNNLFFKQSALGAEYSGHCEYSDSTVGICSTCPSGLFPSKNYPSRQSFLCWNTRSAISSSNISRSGSHALTSDSESLLYRKVHKDNVLSLPC
jgi:hypothetical protein